MLEGKKISELDPIDNLSLGCCFPLLSKGATKRITFSTLLNEIEKQLPESGINEVKAEVDEVKADVEGLTVKAQGIDTLNAEMEEVKTDVASVDEMIQGQNATIRNCVSTVEDLERTVEQTHFEDVLELEAQVRANATKINTIETVIPAQASAENKLADKNFVNSTVGTNTANYISNNGEPFTSLNDLQSYSGTVTNNDYAFVTGTDEAGNTYFDRYKANVSRTTVSWGKEYRLNNSSFTAEQWSAITSGITATKLNNLLNHTNDKNNPHSVTKAQVGLGNCDNTADVNKNVNYATSSGNSDTVDGLHGDQLGTRNAAGYSHGTNWPLYCQYNKEGDGRFKLTIDGQITKTDYANSAGSAPASDVYPWAKQPNKPSYSANEISGVLSASVLSISTNEINTGATFVNGKTIYRKAFTFSSSVGITTPSWVTIETNTSINRVLQCWGWNNRDGAQTLPIPARIKDNRFEIQNTYYSSDVIGIWLEYTK